MQPESGEALFAQLRARVTPALAGSQDTPLQQAHPPDALLDALHGNWLPSELRDDLRMHLVSCAPCRSRFAARQWLRTAAEEAPASVSAGVTLEAADIALPVEAVDAPILAEPALEQALALTPRKTGWGPSAAFIPMGLLLFLLLPLGMGELLQTRVPRAVYTGRKGAKGPSWTKGIEKLYANFSTRTLLHLGITDGFGKPVRRLHRESTCRSHQSLFFGFSLASPGGYAYVFRIDPRGQARPELLFPFDPARPGYVPGASVHVIQQKGVTQRYPLEQERRDVLFVLLQRQTPLSTHQRKALLQQRSGWGERMQALAKAGLAGAVSYDRFLVRMSQPAPGGRR